MPISSVPDFLCKAGKGRKISTFPEKSLVFAQGEECKGLFRILKGRVKLSVVSKSGKQAIIGLLGPGDFLGEGCLDFGFMAMTTAMAISDSSILHIGKETFQEALHTQPAVADFFLRYLLSRNHRYEQDLIDQLFNSSEKRLARILLLMARYGKEGDLEPRIPNVSQETLAELVGTTRSRVNKFMRNFERLGFISYEGGLTIQKSLLQIVLHDDNPLATAQAPSLFSRPRERTERA